MEESAEEGEKDEEEEEGEKKGRANKKTSGLNKKRRELRAFFFNALSACLVLSCLVRGNGATFGASKGVRAEERSLAKALNITYRVVEEEEEE